MPAIDFPASPSVNDEYSFKGRTWLWNGTGWEVKSYPAALQLGSASAPSLYFTGDPNTGLYSPDADQVAITTGASERMRIDSSGRVGIGATSPAVLLDCQGTGTQIIRVRTNDTSGSAVGILRAEYLGGGGGINTNTELRAGDQYSYLVNTTNHPLLFGTGGTERARIDSSGRLLVGLSSGAALVHIGNSVDSLFMDRNESVAGGPNASFRKSRGTSGAPTIVNDGDFTGALQFRGYDGAAYITNVTIRAEVDGTPGTNDMPGRLVLSTTLDGASSPTEAFRITNDRVRCYNQAAPAAVDTTATLTVANLKTGIITSSTAAAVTMTLPTGTDTEAGFSGIYTNMTFEWSVINTGATNAVTVQGGTGHTLVGTGTVAASSSGRFASRRTAANTFVTYRLSS
jgi:hypothetical protein